MSHRLVGTGFTLIELLIAVAIVGILATIAVPSYRGYVVRANRADAQQTLLRAAQGLERYAVTNGSRGYAGAALGALAVVVPVDRSPASGPAVYSMSLDATATTFTVTATPSADGANRSDGYLQLNQAGLKTWQGHRDWSR